MDVEPTWTGSSWTYTGSIPASRVIAKAAKFWGINPQVLLATLQKEESLITGTSCDSWRYNSAMGYGCPDSGGCNPKYVGFTRQVLWGGWQLKFNKERSLGNVEWDGDGDITYVGLMTQGQRKRCTTCQTFTFDGNATIDGQTIHLDTAATASLYTYTPHLGQAFPGIFESYFGSVIATRFAWGFEGQGSNKALNGILPGQTATFTISARNAGNQTWTKAGTNPVHLGTTWPQDRSSPFATGSWLSPARPAALNENTVAPGDVGTFTFTVVTPNTPGHYKEHYSLLSEGEVWMNDPGVYFDIVVLQPVYSWSMGGQEAYTDSSKAAGINLTQLSPGQTGWLVLRAKNTGNMTWSKTGPNAVHLGVDWPRDGQSRFSTPAWIGANRPTGLVEASVAPGQTGTFEFPIRAPAINAAVDQHYTPVVEGITWMNDFGAYFQSIVHGAYSWSLTSQFAYTDSGKTTGVDLSNLTPGQTIFIGFTARNTGTATWFNAGSFIVNAATARPTDRSSAFANGSWLSPARPVKLKEASVPPGQIGTFEFTYTAPATKGTYYESFRPVAEGIVHMNDVGMYFYTVVR
jgi:hypothetical protein